MWVVCEQLKSIRVHLAGRKSAVTPLYYGRFRIFNGVGSTHAVKDCIVRKFHKRSMNVPQAAENAIKGTRAQLSEYIRRMDSDSTLA